MVKLELFGTNEIAERLNVTQDAIKKMVYKGWIEPYKIGRTLVFTREMLETIKEKRKKRTGTSNKSTFIK